MGLREDIPMILKEYDTNKGRLETNRILLDIYEGDLLPHVLSDLKNQLHPKAFEQAKHRPCPINISERYIEKVSAIYTKPPKRDVQEGKDQDKELIANYEKTYKLNTVAAEANRNFNLFQCCAFEPYLFRGKPQLRVIPSDRFFVCSTNKTNPLMMTHFVKIMGKVNDKVVFYAYTDDEFLAFNQDEDILTDLMVDEDGNPTLGLNPVKKIPFVYVNRSTNLLNPKANADLLSMTKLIPILLTDLNFANMYLSFSITYVIDADDEALERNPNAIWMLKSDPQTGKAPQVGTVKPEVDIDKALSLLQTQFALWLETKGVKPGAVGALTIGNAASGLAKMLDESDTSSNRTKQVPYFVTAEEELFDLTINHLHPIWMNEPGFEKNMAFTKGVKVSVTFPEQKALVDSSKVIADEEKKISMRIQDREGALQEIYPDWTPEQIKERLARVDKSREQEEPENEGQGSPAEEGAEATTRESKEKVIETAEAAQ